MCSWCYGFSPELEKLMMHYKDRLRFSIIMGGLRPDGMEWTVEIKDFLRHHWEEVAEKTGQPFNFDLLKKKEFNYNTEPACRSVVVARDLAPEKTFRFFKSVQRHFYFLNDDPTDIRFYRPVCDNLGIDKNIFEKKFLSKKYKNKTLADFAHSRQPGIRGFPSLVLWTGGEEIRLVTHGYATFDKMKDTVEKLLE